jgi:predicted ATPase
MEIFRRRFENMQSCADAVIRLCSEHGFVHWVACGRILEGWAAVCDGRVDRGIEILREGIVAWQQGGARLWLPIFLTLQAEAYAAADRKDAALRAIEQALVVSEETGERWADAEVLRVKARLLLATDRTAADEIETLLVRSLEVARNQQARCFELRAACDLARLWHVGNRSEQALQLLRSIYGQFTEGFDSAELQDAKALINTLAR